MVMVIVLSMRFREIRERMPRRPIRSSVLVGGINARDTFGYLGSSGSTRLSRSRSIAVLLSCRRFSRGSQVIVARHVRDSKWIINWSNER